jgi:phospholipase/carboxylesterase
VMPSWYDIRTFDRVPDREDAAHVRASAERIRALIAREVERGVPEHHIVLAGFSQGAALTLHTGLRHPRPLAGLIVLSGYLVLEETVEQELTPAGRATPVLFGHGTEDEVVSVAAGRLSHDRVRALGVATEWHDWPIGHAVSPEEIAVVRRWLHQRLDSTPPGGLRPSSI